MPTYAIQMKCPMGIKRGQARVRWQKQNIVLELLGGENYFDGEFIQNSSNNETFALTGSFKTALYNLPASLIGELSEDSFQAILRTERGAFPIEGVLEQDGAEPQ